ncbi:MAG: hypothetical protein IJZ74_07150 [Clostridia bacterium]|nr:hypothetical protein [Clostridia bacterium]
MKKKSLLLTTILCLSMTATACSRPTNQEYYEEAQLYLGSGSCDMAAMLFSQLGEYQDSADYALYSAGLHALSEGDTALARANLNAVHPFKSSARYLQYIEAIELEAAGELEEALDRYEALGSFEDSASAAENLRKTIPEKAIQQGRKLMSEGDYAAARDLFLSLDGYGQSTLFAQNCTAALNKAAYAEASALCDAGDHLAAMNAFLALGDVLDAPDRAERCRAALTAELDATDASLDNAAGLIAAYAALGNEERAADLSARYAVNLALIAAAAEQPYVLLGAYPMGESGVESPLLWRVLSVENTTATLLCEAVIDASPVATSTALTLTEAERAAVTSSTLPAMTDLTSLTDLTCSATPYAAAQGVEQESGQALYWLRDSLESGLHPVVDGSGSLALPAASMTPGVRPMITLSLDTYVFTAGDGSMENPFR